MGGVGAGAEMGVQRAAGVGLEQVGASADTRGAHFKKVSRGLGGGRGECGKHLCCTDAFSFLQITYRKCWGQHVGIGGDI